MRCCGTSCGLVTGTHVPNPCSVSFSALGKYQAGVPLFTSHSYGTHAGHPHAPKPAHDLPHSVQRWTVVTAAQASSQQGKADEGSVLPESREEAIAQACAALSGQLSLLVEASKGKSRKGGTASGAARSSLGFLGSGASRRISVEIPVADESDAAALELARDLVSGIPSPWQEYFTIVNGRVGTVDLDIISSKCLIITAPRTPDLERISHMVGNNANHSIVVLLNPEWGPYTNEDESGAVPQQHAAFIRSFDTVYCFMPIIVKSFGVPTNEGAVFRFSLAGSAGKRAVGRKSKVGFGNNEAQIPASENDAKSMASPWRVFKRKGKNWEAVARMGRRPSNAEVEVCFYNASAADSPLTQGAKFLRNLVGKNDTR